MGGDGWPAVQGFGVERLDQMLRFRRHCETVIGDDILTEYVRRS
jgi:riboflavin biosynthesis pyrimidine reductase